MGFKILWHLLVTVFPFYPSHSTPPYSVKVKINFDEAQKLTWKEIKHLYGLIKIITLNNISELLKMQLESRSRNVHTLGPVAGSFQHKLWLRGKASEAVILVSRVFAFVFSWYKVIIALSLCFSSGALQHTVHTSITAAKIVLCFSRPSFSGLFERGLQGVLKLFYLYFIT